MSVVFNQAGSGAGRLPRRGSVLAAFLAAAGMLLSTGPVPAASLGVSPTLVALPASQNATGVRVSNQDTDSAIQVQARLFRWRQEDGQEVYTPADDLMLSPPVTRIEPGRENLIRLIRTGPAPEAGELSYRLLLDELPAPVQEKESAQDTSAALSMVIRQAIPVFVTAPQATPAAPEWQVERVNGNDGAQAGYRVSVHNTGDQRLRLADLALSTPEGEVLAQRKGLVGYVLGHARMQFVILDVEGSNTATATSLMLSAQAEKGALSAGPLPVHRPGGD